MFQECVVIGDGCVFNAEPPSRTATDDSDVSRCDCELCWPIEPPEALAWFRYGRNLGDIKELVG